MYVFFINIVKSLKQADKEIEGWHFCMYLICFSEAGLIEHKAKKGLKWKENWTDNQIGKEEKMLWSVRRKLASE